MNWRRAWMLWRFRKWMRRNRVIWIGEGPSPLCERGKPECAGRVS